MRCEYCNKNKAEFDLHNFFTYFTEDNGDIGYNICETCFNRLEQEETLESIYGFNVMLIRFVERENIRFKDGYMHIICDKCRHKYKVLTNAGHILSFNALEEEKRKWEWYLKCDKCGHKNVQYD